MSGSLTLKSHKLLFVLWTCDGVSTAVEIGLSTWQACIFVFDGCLRFRHSTAGGGFMDVLAF